jgi:glutamate synthase (NADPH/NADH) small chain
MSAKTPRHKMPEQKPEERIKNFNEVPLGYTAEMAIAEAERCLQCKKPACVEGCPVNVKIPEFIKEVAEGNFLKAIEVIKETNSLPAVCGRVCPQESQCEEKCVLGKKFEPVAIGKLEGFVADYEREKEHLPAAALKSKNRFRPCRTYGGRGACETWLFDNSLRSTSYCRWSPCLWYP